MDKFRLGKAKGEEEYEAVLPAVVVAGEEAPDGKSLLLRLLFGDEEIGADKVAAPMKSEPRAFKIEGEFEESGDVSDSKWSSKGQMGKEEEEEEEEVDERAVFVPSGEEVEESGEYSTSLRLLMMLLPLASSLLLLLLLLKRWFFLLNKFCGSVRVMFFFLIWTIFFGAEKAVLPLP